MQKRKIEGTKNLFTDEAGLKIMQATEKMLMGIPFDTKDQMLKMTRQHVMRALNRLKVEKRLWLRDGSRVV